MLAVLHIVLAFLGALVLVQRVIEDFPPLVRLAAAFAAGTVLTGWATFLAASFLHLLGGHDVTFHGALLAGAGNAALVVAGRRDLRRAELRVPWPALAGVAAAAAVSGWIMAMRLAGDPLQVSLNVWGDTGLHIGIARSFSAGDNYPPVLPIFGGEGIRYHFGFDFVAGVLERLGLPIEWAFNLPGVLGFVAIMVLLAEIARYLWGSVATGVVAAVLFVTNGSLAFLRYFAQFPYWPDGLRAENWWNHAEYLAIGPYEPDEPISLFWTLNPYLTQTHLILSTAIVLLLTYALLRHLRGPGGMRGDEPIGETPPPALTAGRAAALGVLSGASFWINGILFLVSTVFFCALFLALGPRVPRPRATAVLVVATVGMFALGAALESDALRVLALVVAVGGVVVLGPWRTSLPFLAVSGVVAAPQLVWLSGGLASAGSLTFHTGYLVEGFRLDQPASWADAAGYWWLNLGVVGPLVVLAAVLGRRADRALLAAVMAIFLLGNVVVFGIEVGGHNHKVFNLWETLVNLFAAYALVWLARRWRTGVGGRVVAAVTVPVLAVALVLSGLLDMMTLKNDPRYDVFGDRTAAIAWIAERTPVDAVFLTSFGDPYTVPTLAGRTVYIGGFSSWPNIMGYDHEPREARVRAVYAAPDRAGACALLAGTGIDFVQLSSSEQAPDRFPDRNPELFPGDFVRVYEDGRYSYFDVRASCGTDTTALAGG